MTENWIKDDKARIQQIRLLVSSQFEKRSQASALGGLLTEWTDQFLINLATESMAFHQVTERQSSQDVAIIAVGGFGRAELAPYSDIDLLFLYRDTKAAWFEPVVATIVRRCWDGGLKLGHSLRKLNETISLAKEDIQVATSLVDTRLIWGSESLHHDLRTQYDRFVIKRRWSQFYVDCVKSREEERNEHGQSAQYLEPDVKRAAGGLRDIHLIRWLAYSLTQETKLDIIWKQGLLSSEEYEAIRVAQEFYTRIRFYLHMGSGRCYDILSRSEQLRIANAQGYKPTPVQQPVEQFMQKYFQHATTVREITNRFTQRNRPGRRVMQAFSSLFTRRIQRHYLLRPDEIDVVSGALTEVTQSLEQTLKFFQLSERYSREPNPLVLDLIQKASPNVQETLSREAATTFLDILKDPQTLGKTIRLMYEYGTLERVIPEFRHCRGLLQFNQYHSYTVDEHTMRAVEAAQKLEYDPDHIGRVYRSLKNKEILYLSIILHDMAKGYEEDHSILGAKLAIEVGHRLYLPEDQVKLLSFLVRWHLHMSDLALRRDVNDQKITSTFAHLVGDSNCLRHLYLLTVADIQAVGPGVWTQWKSDLLKELYDKTLGHFGEESESPRLNVVKEEDILTALKQRKELGQWNETLSEQFTSLYQSLPLQYVHSNTPQTIQDDLILISQLAENDARVSGRFDEVSGLIEYLIIGRHGFSRGIFERICGVLTAMRLKIVTAQIATSKDGIILDRIRLTDQDFPQKPPQWRIDEIAEVIKEHLYRPTSLEKLFKKYKRYGNLENTPPLAELPLRVVPDQNSSDHYTIIDIFAHDRPGLLLTITRALNEFGMSIVMAKIATHYDQVVDVFYVTDERGVKIDDPYKLSKLVTTIEQRLHEFEERGYKLFQQ